MKELEKEVGKKLAEAHKKLQKTRALNKQIEQPERNRKDNEPAKLV